jgi:hypothetical protein
MLRIPFGVRFCRNTALQTAGGEDYDNKYDTE